MEKLGINGIQLLAQLLNVGILLVVLKKFLYKPMLHILEKRRALAQEVQEKETELTKQLASLEEKEKELVRQAKVKADQQVRDALLDAKKAAAALIKDAEEKAAKRRDQIMKTADLEIARAKSDMDGRVREEAVKLANDALKELLPDETRVKLTEAQVAKLLRS